MKRLCFILLAGVHWMGCGTEDPVACVSAPAPDCAPAYEATYSAVYENTILRSCAVGGGACHDAAEPFNGLSLQGEAQSLDTLLSGGWVLPFDPECSEMFVRIADHGHAGAMPPGSPLSPEEQCAIGQWIEEGALP